MLDAVAERNDARVGGRYVTAGLFTAAGSARAPRGQRGRHARQQQQWQRCGWWAISNN